MAAEKQGTALAEKQTTVPEYAKPPRETFIGRFLVLRGAMPELWITFAVKLLGVAAYGVMNSTLVLWLCSDLGYSDEKALGVVGIWAILMSVATLLAGSLTDAIGLRKAYLVGVGICVFARGLMTFTTVPWLAIGCGMMPLAIGEALGTPVMVAGIRRYSTTAQRSISFSLFYVLMNAGFALAGLIFDFVRRALGEHGHMSLPLTGLQISTYQVLFLASLAIELLLVPLLYFGIRSGAEATEEGVRIIPEEPKYSSRNVIVGLCLTTRDAACDTVRVFKTLVRQPGFYRLLTFLSLIAAVKLVYVTMLYVYPKFGIRELGEGAPIGRLWSVTNSVLIIVLVPLVGVLFQRVSAYRMVAFGCAVVAASVFILALPSPWFQSLASGTAGRWIGHFYLGLTGSINPWYVMLFLYAVVFSVGEAFYSPRVYEYAAAIAPKGQEASYAALSYIPLFLAKLLVGVFSGRLLATYCPEAGPRHPETMWLVIALVSTIAPVGLIVLRRWVRVREAGRE